jgi:exosortase A-associated hydrolase 2
LSRIQALHLDFARSRRFAVLHEPVGPPRGLVVHAQAFGEEMNKSRRMVSLQARAFAATGFAVLLPDLLGCGDSDGDFADATWEAWIDDVAGATAWLQRRHPQAADTTWLWGLRAGCLLAAAAVPQLPQPVRLLAWQPVLNGKAFLQQFLRLKAASRMQSGEHKGVVESLRHDLAAGRTVEIAGYELAPALASALEKAAFAPVVPAGTLCWVEAGARDPAELLPASSPALERWRAAGWQVAAQAVSGPSFWQTQEIEEAPALVEWTTRLVAGGAA